MRFRLIVICFMQALFLSACSSTWTAANDTLKLGLAEYRKAPPINIDTVKNTPYFQIGVERKYVNTVFLLTRISQHHQYWQSAAQESLILQHGLIVRTTGIDNNLEQTRFIDTNPFAIGLLNLPQSFNCTRIIDLSPYRYGITVHSTFNLGPMESINILGNLHTLQRIDEKIEAPDIQLTATNHYWLDKNGFIWKSEQTLWNDFTLIITQLKPYGINP